MQQRLGEIKHSYSAGQVHQATTTRAWPLLPAATGSGYAGVGLVAGVTEARRLATSKPAARVRFLCQAARPR